MALPKKAAPAVATAYVNFGDLGQYSGGAAVPEGDYALTFQNMRWKPPEGKYVERLGVMVTCTPLEGGDAKTKFMAMGDSADKVFSPDPDTGKRLVVKPDAENVGGNLNRSTNWALFLKSMYDCGLPNGVFTNDLSTIDGVHVHLANEPEPEERKGYKNKKTKTGEGDGQEEERKGSGFILVVTEIKDDGKPWEGGGGVPGDAPTPAAAAPKPNGKMAPKPVATKPAPVEQEAGAALTADDVAEAAQIGVAGYLEKNTNGGFAVAVRTGTFKEVAGAFDDSVAQAVASFLSDDDNLQGVVEVLGFKFDRKVKKILPA
jgi:hypothetical protein